MEPPRKHARLQELRAKLPYVSQSALAAVLKHLTLEDTETASNRDDLRNARDAYARIATPYESTHQSIEVEGCGKNVEIQHPLAMLYHMSATSPCMARLIRKTAAAIPCTPEKPWRVLIYFDEV